MKLKVPDHTHTRNGATIIWKISLGEGFPWGQVAKLFEDSMFMHHLIDWHLTYRNQGKIIRTIFIIIIDNPMGPLILSVG
jgi:hypothetical protein